MIRFVFTLKVSIPLGTPVGQHQCSLSDAHRSLVMRSVLHLDNALSTWSATMRWDSDRTHSTAKGPTPLAMFPQLPEKSSGPPSIGTASPVSFDRHLNLIRWMAHLE